MGRTRTIVIIEKKTRKPVSTFRQDVNTFSFVWDMLANETTRKKFHWRIKTRQGLKKVM